MGTDLRLLISCPHKNGTISSFVSMRDGNILSAGQYASDSGAFFMRLEGEEFSPEHRGIRVGSSV